MIDVRKGLYRHFKGGIYEVIGVGTHTETNEQFVIYRDVDKDDEIWLRPVGMFISKKQLPNGDEVPRFERLKNSRKKKGRKLR